MSVIVREGEADLGVLDGRRMAVVGYGNQGRSWALNLRDSGLDVSVCVRADDTRTQPGADPRTDIHDRGCANAARSEPVIHLVTSAPVSGRERHTGTSSEQRFRGRGRRWCCLAIRR